MKFAGSDLPAGTKVVVGMSGGVDSSLAAWQLKQAGCDVTGAFMRCWDDDGVCTAGQDAIDAAVAADLIGIELEEVDFIDQYRDRVFASFLSELNAGRTPNPDVWCNEMIKFGAFADYALNNLKSEYLATGHYARIAPHNTALIKAEDESKDQTYFLYRVPSQRLNKLLFPLGGQRKSEVRKLAKQAGFPNADRPESMGICFVGKRPFREFISAYVPERSGYFVSDTGVRLGEHKGAHLFTIGQRRGLGQGGPGEPWFVAAKDIKANTVTVVRGRDHPLLTTNSITLVDCHWFDQAGPSRNWVYTCCHRYRMPPAPCTVTATADDNRVTIDFAGPQWAVATGQAAVVYDGIYCLGGGTISATRSQVK